MKNSFFYLLLIFPFHIHFFFCVSQDISGFISIDCGSGKSSSFKGLQYSTDAGYIDSGQNHNVSANYMTENVPEQIQNLRSFPDGQRNCYNLSVAAAGRKGKKYVIMAHFLYGNYDGKNVIPQFDLYLGVEKWSTISTANSGQYLWWEIIHVPVSNYVYVCLVNTGDGIPYISALELRPMNVKAYSSDPQVSLQNVQRSYFGSSNQIIRYPDDVYDRRWSHFPTATNLKELNTTSTIDNSNIYSLPPTVVLQSAVTPKDNTTSIFLNWNGVDSNTKLFFCFYFSEMEQHDQARVFDVYLNGIKGGSIGLMNLGSIQSIVVHIDTGNTPMDINFTLQKSVGSAYPPIISGVEKFIVKQFLQAQTDENDVFAVVNIKATYGLKKSSWQGDPCLPQYFSWEGLDCVTFDDQTTPPRIKYLDLSSSGVSGLITPYLSGLKALEFLDLSHNNLSGPIPDFLAELPSLKVLNLSGNNFNGPVPQKLVEMVNNGLLLRINDTDPTKKNGIQWKSIIKILALSFLGLFLISATALFIIYRKRIIKRDRVLFCIPKQKDVDMEDKSGKFTMAEITNMTKKFKNPIGKGGFGQVFRGTMTDGTEVAVKLLSSDSTQGHRQLEAEVKLLKRTVSHQNLTPILGYCDEGMEMAIVYKYMPNGCLNKFLSTDSEKVLTWRQRLSIALGATQGLHYLHECHFIHRDVKPENILLDEKLEAKLGDYGLVREFKENRSHVTTALQGTHGYVDPEYGVNDQLREKSDVYSMGVVLLRLITGKPLAIHVGNEIKHITHWLKDVDVNVNDDNQMQEIVDPKLEGNFELESIKKAFKVATKCAAPKSDSRPNMSEVVKELEECLKLARGQ